MAINRFGTDSDAEIQAVEEYCAQKGVPVKLAEVFAKGGDGGVELAQEVCKVCETQPSHFAPIYDEALPIKEKIGAVARAIYHAGEVAYSAQAEKAMVQIEKLGFDKLPICVAKTQYSLSDDPAKLGSPEGYTPVSYTHLHYNSVHRKNQGFLQANFGNIRA